MVGEGRPLLPKLLGQHVSLGVTAEALRANIGSKSAISLQRGPVDPKFQVAPQTTFYLRKLG